MSRQTTVRHNDQENNAVETANPRRKEIAMKQIMKRIAQLSLVLGGVLALGQPAQADTFFAGNQVTVMPTGTATRLYNVMQGAHDFAMATNGDFVVSWKGEATFGGAQELYKREYSAGVAGSTFLAPPAKDGSAITVGSCGLLNSIGMDRAGNYILAWENAASDIIQAAKYAPGAGAVTTWTATPMDGSSGGRRGPNMAVYSGGSGAFIEAGA